MDGKVLDQVTVKKRGKSALTPDVTAWGRPRYLITGYSPVVRAQLRYLNKIQQLSAEFMVPLRDEVFPLWRTFMDIRIRSEAAAVADELASRVVDLEESYRLGGWFSSEVAWQLHRWAESGTMARRFERENEIAETLVCGSYPFAFPPTLDFEEKPVPDCTSRIRPEAYRYGRDYAGAVYSVLGERGVWKLSPDHVGLDRDCEILVRYQVIGEQPAEIISRMALPMTAGEVMEIAERMAANIAVPLREPGIVRYRARLKLCKAQK
ncbi:MAG: hypothetical protein KIT79_09690 [Deltaproteobacteria bacterium]|nr:hypothetical protein [Deltaproteobacteria bacterium]